jgi:class 3 adenylate cyclase/tetratricopeptide (TPR) repeat protein
LAEKILDSRGALEGERKQVTVLFADIKGSLELIESSDPEAAQALLDPAVTAMMEAVHRYEGTVNKVLGDGIMALFGAPVAHEDHAVRACYAALAIQDAIRRHGEAVLRSHGVTLQARVGLHSGDVVVRSIGNDLSMDYDAIGATVHLAGRMEQLALPGSIRLTPSTFHLAEGFVQVGSLGPVPIKGLAEPVELFELISTSRLRSRLQASAARGLTRFVGREVELQALGRALERAGEGSGQVVAVMGEAGVGKSRLFYEFVRSHRTQNWLVLESSSVSYGKATNYLPVIELLKAYFDVGDRDDTRTVRERVTGKLMTLDDTLRPTLPAFLDLLDVPVEDEQWRAVDPSQRHQRTQDAVRALLLRESRIQPLVLVFEDLHWIDSETQTILDSLVESLPTAQLLLLVNYRPEFQDRWGNKSYYARLRIDPLQKESAEALLSALLGDAAGLEPLKKILIEHTDGNPFYLEECVRTLAETESFTGERGNYKLAKAMPAIEIPVAVETLLAARIDRLPPDDKRLLQSAAVIGKDVPFPLLLRIADISENDLRRGLSHLQSAEFLYETRLYPDLEHTFKHALTREVAYAELLKDRRKTLHGRVAQAIETLYSDNLGPHASALAKHYREADLPEQAIPYTIQAGDAAADRYASAEAMVRYDEALEMAKSLPASEQAWRFQIRAILKLATVASNREHFERNLAILEQARLLAEELDHKPRLSQILYWIGRTHYVLGHGDLGIEYGEKSLEIAESMGGDNLTAAPVNLLGRLHNFTDPKIAVELLARSVDQMHVLGNRIEEAGAAGLLGWSYAVLGRFKEALEAANHGVEVAKKIDHMPTLAACLHYRGQFQSWRADLEASLRDLGTALDLVEESGDVFRKYIIYGCRGDAYRLAGDLQHAVPDLAKSVDLGKQIGTNFRLAPILAQLAEVHLRGGDLEAALNFSRKAMEIAVEVGQPLDLAAAYTVAAQVALTTNPPDLKAAEAAAVSAIEICEKNHRNYDLAWALVVHGRVLNAKGNCAEAKETLARAAEKFQEMGIDRELQQVMAEVELLAD